MLVSDGVPAYNAAMTRVLVVTAMIAGLVGCDGSPNPNAGACEGLGALECRATAGCELDFCFACSCAPTYMQCRPAVLPPYHCPELGCAQPLCCNGQADCNPSNTLRCVGPEAGVQCGICDRTPGSCTTDAACDPAGTARICELILCSCIDQRECVPGCAGAAPCGDGLVCDVPTSRCVPLTCGAAAPCPDNFDCAAGSCTRRACTSDAQCDGFCVDGACFDALGTCMPPAA